MPSSLWTYLPSAPGGPLEVDRVFYGRLARETDKRTKVDGFVVPIRSGLAWPVRADRYFMKASPAKKGDFFEFFAEIDLLCAISTCPGGDLSIPLWGPAARDPISVCRPLGVEVHQPAAELLVGWRSPQPPDDYRGRHGLKMPVSP